MNRLRGVRVMILAGVLAGCAGGSEQANPGEGPDDDGRSGLIKTAGAVASLTRADSCDNLLAGIQSDVATKVALQAELMRDAEQYGQGAPGRGVDVGNPIAGPGFANGGAGGAAAAPPLGMAPSTGTPVPGGSPTPAPGQPTPTTPTDNGEGTASLGPKDHSETNTQVEGVDEADIVKTDGSHIYLLHGNALFVFDSWPAAETAVTGSIKIEGTVSEMFVHDGMAAVFSLVYDQGDLIEQQKPAADVAAGASFGPGYYYGSPFTKVTLVDVTGAQPQVARQLLIEGNYLSARLHGTTVRTVIQGGFRTPPLFSGYIEYRDPWGREYPQEDIDAQVDLWRDRVVAAVKQTKLSDWLPTEREIIDGRLTEPARRCTDFYAPSPGLTNYGLTNIVSFDIADPASKLGGAIVLGAADEVYSNESSLLLAHRDYRFEQQLIQRERTVLHRFELDGADTTYAASGFVPGHILDQFSLDERAGTIRVSTSIRSWQNFVAPLPAIAQEAADADDEAVARLQRETDNRVITLQTSGEKLVRVGITDPLGRDGETIFSTRFVGDRGYVVTFMRTDPLIVVDLADPAHLAVLGQAHIPGFSDYMHPLDDGHLVTIGRDADPVTGIQQGLQLQIFDVTDPMNPRRTFTYEFADGGYSEANVHHKAFTFHKPEGAVSEGLLAFPYVNYSYPTFGSSLEVFRVSAGTGFEKLGSVDHTGMLQNLCGTQYDPSGGVSVFIQCVQPEVRRGLFIFGNDGDFVYSISNGGVLVHELADMATAVASVPLQIPDISDQRVVYGVTGAVPPGTMGGGSTPPPVQTTPVPAPTPMIDPAAGETP